MEKRRFLIKGARIESLWKRFARLSIRFPFASLVLVLSADKKYLLNDHQYNTTFWSLKASIFLSADKSNSKEANAKRMESLAKRFHKNLIRAPLIRNLLFQLEETKVVLYWPMIMAVFISLMWVKVGCYDMKKLFLQHEVTSISFLREGF